PGNSLKAGLRSSCANLTTRFTLTTPTAPSGLFMGRPPARTARGSMTTPPFGTCQHQSELGTGCSRASGFSSVSCLEILEHRIPAQVIQQPIRTSHPPDQSRSQWLTLLKRCCWKPLSYPAGAVIHGSGFAGMAPSNEKEPYSDMHQGIQIRVARNLGVCEPTGRIV